MKLAALGILNKSDVLVDIFGDKTSRGPGLLTLNHNEDFDARLLHFKEAWGSTPQGDKFYSYFLVRSSQFAEQLVWGQFLYLQQWDGKYQFIFEKRNLEVRE